MTTQTATLPAEGVTTRPAGRYADLRDSILAGLHAAGYDVYMRPPVWGGAPEANCYAFFTDGTRIGYVQWSDGVVKWTSCHQPSRQVGTGFEAGDAEDALNMTCPGWASRDAGHVRKWRDWEAFVASSKWNSELSRVAVLS